MTGITTRSHAADGGREPRLRQPRLLRDQRGPRQGDALRRQRRRGARRASRWLRDVFGPALGRALRAARRHAAQAADRARARRWATRCTSATSPARACCCASSRRRSRAPSKDAELVACLDFIGRQRSVLPQHRDGDGQGASPIRRAASRLVGGHRDVPQRHRLRHSRRGHRRPLVHRAGRDAGRALLSRASARRTPIPTWATRRSSRPSASAPSPWRRRRRWSASSAPGAPPRPRRSPARWREITVGAQSRSGPSRRSTSPACRPASTCGCVVETGIAPAINTGIAHREPGVGQVGAGVVRAPLACFEEALRGVRRDHGRRMSVILNEVRRGFYLDSVALMRMSRQIAACPGVEEAGLMIGTPANKEILRDAGLLGAGRRQRRAERPDHRAAGERCARRRGRARGSQAAARSAERARRGGGGRVAAHPSRRASSGCPTANLALISVPGEFAVAEARKALEPGST